MPAPIKFWGFFIDEHGEEVEEEMTLHTRWEICDDCRGEGKSSAYLGAYTSDEMHEAGPEFQEDYMNGFYDKPCSSCKGKGKVEVPDEEIADPKALKAYHEMKQIEWEMDREQEAERKMGA